MKLGSSCVFRSEALHGILRELDKRLIEETRVNKAFHILEETIFERGEEITHFRIYEIPIQEVCYTPPKLGRIPFHDNSYTFRERIKILFKGRL